MPRPAVDAGSDESVAGRLLVGDGMREVGGRGRHGRRPQNLGCDDDGETAEREWSVLQGAEAWEIGVLEHKLEDADQVRDVILVPVVEQERCSSAPREDHRRTVHAGPVWIVDCGDEVLGEVESRPRC